MATISNIYFSLAVICLTLCVIDGRFLSDRESELQQQRDQIDSNKRPFCNAFTGCGRKRSEEQKNQHQKDTTIQPKLHNSPKEYYSDESVASMLDLNAEPAIEDLMRQIMSEVARREIYLQNQDTNPHPYSNDPQITIT